MLVVKFLNSNIKKIENGGCHEKNEISNHNDSEKNSKSKIKLKLKGQE